MPTIVVWKFGPHTNVNLVEEIANTLQLSICRKQVYNMCHRTSEFLLNEKWNIIIFSKAHILAFLCEKSLTSLSVDLNTFFKKATFCAIFQEMCNKGSSIFSSHTNTHTHAHAPNHIDNLTPTHSHTPLSLTSHSHIHSASLSPPFLQRAPQARLAAQWLVKTLI